MGQDHGCILAVQYRPQSPGEKEVLLHAAPRHRNIARQRGQQREGLRKSQAVHSRYDRKVSSQPRYIFDVLYRQKADVGRHIWLQPRAGETGGEAAL